MALPALVGGADCGPSNPLQGLRQRFDQDRGIQQDHFGSGRVGSSSGTFRTHQTSTPAFDQDAARFFAAQPSSAPQIIAKPGPLDLSALYGSLPSTSAAPAVAQSSVTAAWASDFLMQQPQQQGAAKTLEHGLALRQVPQERAAGVSFPAVMGAMPTVGVQPWMVQALHPAPVPDVHAYQPIRHDDALWDKEFQSQENSLSEAAPAATASTSTAVSEADDLARAAAEVIDCLKDEQNPKFANSQFMGLMRQLRDGEVVVEGNRIVERTEATQAPATAVDKGKGRAVDVGRGLQAEVGASLSGGVLQSRLAPSIADTVRQNLAEAQEASSVQSEREQEDPDDAYFRQDNEDYIRYWNRIEVEHAPASTKPILFDSMHWGELQEQWEQFEATAVGVKPVDEYRFQPSNPYLLGQSSATQPHGSQVQSPRTMQESVLELEAAVQRNPADAAAWFELGVKQQENEREYKALQALRQAAELDPAHLPTWLALAVSYTNESDRMETYAAIKEWVDRNEAYRAASSAYYAQAGPEPTSLEARFERLIQCLINMARSNEGDVVDADTQIALAVLLNANEDYARAHDCFRTALAVRPDDWLLYNRVGATLANNGNPEQALEFYSRALELNPGYIRARFNLGISCVILHRYDEAVQHILDALVLQDSESASDSLDDRRGVTSVSLWESLRNACTRMQRADLGAICAQRDLNGFMKAFYNN